MLVISGDRDAITLEHTLQIFHALPDAELCVLPGTDHATFSGRSEWLNPIISAFLDRSQAADATAADSAGEAKSSDELEHGLKSGEQ